MKVIAFYLPQYHEIPENNEWWGKGFTEWTTLKKAKQLIDKQYQPRIPLNNNYYDLTDTDTIRWQCKIAKEYGVYGFCFYHYWFDGHLLLQKPVEMFLNDPCCDIPFCICWANEHWTKAWESNQNTVLIEQSYGDATQWKEHFYYFLPFFKDSRYIVEDNKPLLVLYRPELIDQLEEMLSLWNSLAVENGFDGIKFCYQHVNYDRYKNKRMDLFDYAIEYQPGYALKDKDTVIVRKLKEVKNTLNQIIEKKFHKTIDLHSNIGGMTGPTVEDYDTIWKIILDRVPPSDKYIPGAFTDWDNTPRRGAGGKVFLGADPVKFELYFSQLIERAKNIYHKDKIFIFAWNEWTEGGYLEPDQKYKYGYLEAIRSALIKHNEFEV